MAVLKHSSAVVCPVAPKPDPVEDEFHLPRARAGRWRWTGRHMNRHWQRLPCNFGKFSCIPTGRLQARVKPVQNFTLPLKINGLAVIVPCMCPTFLFQTIFPLRLPCVMNGSYQMDMRITGRMTALKACDEGQGFRASGDVAVD